MSLKRLTNWEILWIQELYPLYAMTNDKKIVILVDVFITCLVRCLTSLKRLTNWEVLWMQKNYIISSLQ